MAAGDLQRGADAKRLIPTIFALATGAPPTAIAIVRLSGPTAFAIAATLTGRGLPPPRRLARRAVIDPETGATIDDAMIVCFAGPASATGDDLVEFHLHGGVAIVAAVLAALRECGAAPAAAGAMTRRAFDNGKLDLGQVEALGDLIAAETEGQRRAALARTGTALADRVNQWRAALLAIRADLEATLDFAEEDRVDSGLGPVASCRLASIAAELSQARGDAVRAGRLRDGMTVAIVGPPNVGKSTLFNALARRDAAMVSALPGTTRDVIEARVDLGGLAVTLIDTAGVRGTDDALETEGIRRGVGRAATANVVIALGEPRPVDALAVASKCDLTGVAPGWRDGVFHISAAHGAGLDLLEAAVAARLTALARPSDPPLVAHAWQVAAFDTALAALAAAAAADDAVVIAEELRHAMVGLERLIGRVTPDAVLDSIFARFCIGK